MNKEQKKFWDTLSKPFPKRKHCLNCINLITREHRVGRIVCKFYAADVCCNAEWYPERPESLKKWEWDCIHSY